MATKNLPFDQQLIAKIITKTPTPFYLYDEKAIRANVQLLHKAFSWAPDFKEYFAVKACPNPYIIKLLKEEGCGADCSSLAELVIAEKVGLTGEDICFTSNETPAAEYQKALDLNAVINLDDITHVDFLHQIAGMPETISFRYNPGPLREGGNAIIGKPEDSKYGLTYDQIMTAIIDAHKLGAKRFGLHTMIVSNELNLDYLVGTATMMFKLACDIKNKLDITIDFVNLGGGIGVAYRPEQTPVDFLELGARIKAEYEAILVPAGLGHIKLCLESARAITGPFGYLVSTAIHQKNTYHHYIGMDACMANLMRPALYGAYHHITVLGKENAPLDHQYDVVGSLCENNDKFAIDRALPKIDMGDILVFHDAGAHGYSMGFNYNGKLRSAELLLKPDGSVQKIRRAETVDDYLATIDFSEL